MEGQLGSMVISIVAALGVIGAAIAAWKSVKATRSAAWSQLLYKFMASYEDVKMCDALRLLKKWEKQQKAKLGSDWAKPLDINKPEEKKIDQARRHVKFYFFKAWRLYEAKFVPVEFVKQVGAVNGINIFYDIVGSLELPSSTEYDRAMYRKIKKVCGRYEDGPRQFKRKFCEISSMLLKKCCKLLTIIIGGFIIFLLTAVLLCPTRGEIAIVSDKIEGKKAYVETTLLIKLASLLERERYYKTWIKAVTAGTEGEVVKDEEKVKKIFNWIKDYPVLSELQDKFPRRFIHIAQHEYHNLIKQYGEVEEKTLTFCNLMIIAGYPASPVYSPNNGIVIVKVNTEKYLYFDFENREIITSEEIHDDDEKDWIAKLEELNTSSKWFIGRKYLHGYSQIPFYRIIHTILHSEQKEYLSEGIRPSYLIKSKKGAE
jgi:hypothetical protein